MKTNEKIMKICTANNIDAFRASLARYWCTQANKLEFRDNGSISESGNLKKGVHWQKYRGGFMAYHEVKAKL